MSHDKELFDLCKDVYKRTGWELDSPQWSFTDLFGKGEYERVQARNGSSIPEYTSDYLLEKLPPDAGGMVLQLTHTNPDDEDGWQADYTKFGNNHCYGRGDTAIKALLKLTISLDEAKELI